ncbi:Crp/Fnr family transcriptional regulator [Rhodopseudomonas thermotolerans]|jgi:CRP/FNR family transcriptional regulator|uniref:Crp/Fnr family transcriptional regulator n=2 Tax=Rhodopseudomonas TaxID=1073 RepID=A0A336JS17_9BRAD|nr:MULTISPECIES: Crp/Fnr family transcriptional regulator [Rhodopseudomonas]RED37467.1 Crp/Fnr family transcriptional regulator [Rhodopseudomonas pentothenatexigens]REG03954.1 Crp/Fnr family transcriptional regulator [Rhodopseudomonas thermotolerans]SSW90434.1 Crp/Fnr family transcriptional regulator [Rhodopseudomonas pentothenatexigens]
MSLPEIDWLRGFPALAELPDAERSPLAGAAMAMSLPAGASVFAPDQPCGMFILVCRGTVRVFQLDAEGNEIVLYRLGPGSICILTTLALLASDNYSAFAVTESPVEAIGLPAATFHELMGSSAQFRSFVFHAQAARMADLMAVIQNVAFASIETRLASRLLALAADDRELSITHAQLAAEIGTAREVVSRHLKTFERRGWVSLGRGRVELRNAAPLRAAARTGR